MRGINHPRYNPNAQQEELMVKKQGSIEFNRTNSWRKLKRTEVITIGIRILKIIPPQIY